MINTNTNKKFVNHKPWYNRECHVFKQIVKKRKLEIKKTNYDREKIEEHNKLKNNYFKFLNRIKNEYNSSIIDNLCKTKQSKTFWSIINKYR